RPILFAKPRTGHRGRSHLSPTRPGTRGLGLPARSGDRAGSAGGGRRRRLAGYLRPRLAGQWSPRRRGLCQTVRPLDRRLASQGRGNRSGGSPGWGSRGEASTALGGISEQLGGKGRPARSARGRSGSRRILPDSGGRVPGTEVRRCCLPLRLADRAVGRAGSVAGVSAAGQPLRGAAACFEGGRIVQPLGGGEMYVGRRLGSGVGTGGRLLLGN